MAPQSPRTASKAVHKGLGRSIRRFLAPKERKSMAKNDPSKAPKATKTGQETKTLQKHREHHPREIPSPEEQRNRKRPPRGCYGHAPCANPNKKLNTPTPVKQTYRAVWLTLTHPLHPSSPSPSPVFCRAASFDSSSALPTRCEPLLQ